MGKCILESGFFQYMPSVNNYWMFVSGIFQAKLEQ